MLDRLKFVVKSTLIYSIGTMGIKIIGLILLPIYTDKLTPEQYGMWSLLEISSQILVIVFGFRLSTAMLRFYGSENDKGEKGKIVFNAFAATILSIIIFNLITQFFTGGISSLFFGTAEFASYFKYLFIWTSFEILNQLVLDLIRVKEKPGLFIVVTITKFVLVLLVIIYLIIYRSMGIEGIIIGQLAGSIVLIIISSVFLFKEMNFRIDLTLFKQMLSYGAPLIFSGFSTFILAVGDRYLVKYFLDYHEVGVYSLSYKISNLVKIIFIQAFQRGFLPIAFNMYDKPNAKRFFSKVFTYYVFLVFWSGLALSVFSKEIVYTFASSDAYYEAFRYTPLQTLAICFFGIHSFFLIGLHYAKKTGIIASSTTGVLILNIGLNLVLIPAFGLYGAAVSYIVAGILLVLINYRYSQKYYPIRYEVKKVLIIIGLSVALYFLSTLTNGSILWIRIALKLIMLLSFPFMLYLFRFYEPVEIEKIIGAWRKWRNPKKWKANIRELTIRQGISSAEL